MDINLYKTAATSDYLTRLREVAETAPCVKENGSKSISIQECFECHLARMEDLAFEIERCLNGSSIDASLPDEELFKMLVYLERLRQAHACKAQIFARNLGKSWKYI